MSGELKQNVICYKEAKLLAQFSDYDSTKPKLNCSQISTVLSEFMCQSKMNNFSFLNLSRLAITGLSTENTNSTGINHVRSYGYVSVPSALPE